MSIKISRFIRQQLSLKREETALETYDEIKEGAILKGYNLWILFFAMIIACIGLNINSVGATIGAMLISPLMGPIIGLAFSLAINDAFLKKNSLRNWVIMTVISLIASTLYFLISPFYHKNQTIDSFTAATLFDILLAFFGGLAGFIGIIKKEGTKVIAGVAVATACMPPLCTAGYGLATANFTLALGGFYFYLINCLFIGLATFLLSRFTGYHIDFNCKTTFKKTTNWLWAIFIVLMIMPSVYLVYKKYKEEYNAPPTAITNSDRIEKLEQRVKYLDSIVNKKP